MASVPFWDTVWFSDLIVVGSVVVAVSIYLVQKRGSVKRQRESTLAHLKGVKAAMEVWGSDYFDTDYSGAAAKDRGNLDAKKIMNKDYFQNFRVPTEPVASLIQPPEDAWPLQSATVQAASIALLKMTHFNQLVQQQTDFNLRHAAEIAQWDLPESTRRWIALGARKISENIHGGVIDDGTWYKDLMKAINANIQTLQTLLKLKPDPDVPSSNKRYGPRLQVRTRPGRPRRISRRR
jgi:hypothetical protein